MNTVVGLGDKIVPPEKSNANTLCTPGAVYYRAARYEKALARLNEAVAKQGNGGSPEVRLFMAMTHHWLGHPKEAREWLGRVPEELDARSSPPAQAASLAALLASPSAPAPLLAGTAWPNWAADPARPIQGRLQRQILRREAAALILGKSTGRGR
jgi:hypothetical protein